MGRAQRNYGKEYKEQAVTLAKEIGAEKAARELGVPKGTLYGWMTALRQQMKVLERENRRLKEENEFLAETSKEQRMRFLAQKMSGGGGSCQCIAGFWK